jgi:tetratricopeptide (TPR) repeat protein
VLAERSYALYRLGRWDEALASVQEIPEEHLHDATTASILSGIVEVHLHRGDLGAARRILSLFSAYEGSTEVQDRACYLGAAAAVLRGEARHADAVAAGMEAVELAEASLGLDFQGLKQGLVEAVESALALGEHDRAAELVARIDDIPPGRRAPSLTAHADRFRARLAGDDPSADGAFASAESRFDELGMVFWRAVTQLEHGEWLLSGDRPDEAEPLLTEAREIFERLQATPWLERLAAVEGASAQPAASG